MPTATKKGPSSEATANVVAHALSRATAKEVVLTDEQGENVCKLVHAAKPPTPELRKATERARKFQFVDR